MFTFLYYTRKLCNKKKSCISCAKSGREGRAGRQEELVMWLNLSFVVVVPLEGGASGLCSAVAVKQKANKCSRRGKEWKMG